MKKLLSLMLSVLIVLGSVPTGYLFTSFAVEEKEYSGDSLSVGYYDGMTINDFVRILNSGTGLPLDTPASQWEWFTKGTAEYSYGRYLVDVEIEGNAFFEGISKKNVDVIRALDVYDQYQAGEITREELSERYEVAEFIFFDINIDAEDLRRSVNDSIRSAERSFRMNGKYVSLDGESVTVSSKHIELDYKNDPHCVFTYKINLSPLPDYEGTLCLPTTLEVNGSESYPSVIQALSSGQSFSVRHGDDVYTVEVYGVEHSELVLKPGSEGVYFLPFNKVAGDREIDVLDMIYSQVLDIENSKLSPDFDAETMNGFTVRFYDGRTGWYEFSESEDRLEVGKVYEIEMIYEGVTTVREDFSVALYDPRKAPAVAFYDSETLAIEYTDVETIKKAVFSTLIDASDLPENTLYSDFEYYYFVGDFSRFLEKEIINDLTSSEKFDNMVDRVVDKIWPKVESILSRNNITDSLDKEAFKDEYFNIDYLKQRLVINDWILFDGQQYPVTVDIEGETVELFSINIPSILAGLDYKIKAVYKGNEDNLPAEAVSVSKNLKILRCSSDIEIVDGVYAPGSKLEGLVSTESGLDYILAAVRVDVDYLEMNGIYLQLPESFFELTRVTVGDRDISVLEEVLNVLSSKTVTPRTFRNYVEKLEGKVEGRLENILVRINNLFDKLPSGLLDARIEFNGIPDNVEGIYLVGAVTADINSIPNYDYGVAAVCQPAFDNIIVFDYELAEDESISAGESFDFGAHVFTQDLEPVDDVSLRFCFIGYASGSREIYFSSTAPSQKGQYLQIAVSNSSAPAFRFFNIGLMSVNIASSDTEYEYDGLPHGEPVITDVQGNILPLRESDKAVYVNLLTMESSTQAPSEIGKYSVMVYYSGDAEHKRTTATYEFEIVPKTVNFWVSEYSMVYGDQLPTFVLECEDSELLGQIEYTITPEISFNGNVGTYKLIINIQSMPEGYKANKIAGKLTVTQRPVTIQMSDVTLTFGDDYDPNDSSYCEIVSGNLIGDDSLGLIYEKYQHAGEYEFRPVDYTNKNYALTVIPGRITITPKTLNLKIEDEFIFEGDALPEFTLTGECPEGVVIHIAPAYYDGSVGIYDVFGVCEENSDYNIYIEEGILTVRRRPAKEITVTVPDCVITFGDPLPVFTYETSEEVKDVRFTVSVVDYNGNAGTYSLSVSTSAYDSADYHFTFEVGTLTVTKKALEIKVSDYENVYGNEFDPFLEYKFETDDASIDLSEILKNCKIGAEYFDSEAGSYLLIGKADADNYEITVKSGTLTIRPRPIRVTPLEGQGKEEGQVDGTIEYIAYGLLGEDVLQGELSREPGEEVGLYLITHGTLANKNYEIELDEEYYAIRNAEYQDVVISSLPDKLVYLEGEEFDPTGLVLKAILKNGEEKILTFGRDYTVEGFDTTKPGVQKLSIYYEGFVNKFEVEVKESAVILVKIDTLPFKLNYIQGQEFDPNGIKVYAFFDNGTHRELSLEEIEFAGFDTNAVGEQTISVSFRGVSDSFSVTSVAKQLVGIEVDTTGSKTEYYDAETFSSEGIKVYKVYDSGIKELLNENEYSVSSVSTEVPGEHTVRVMYEGFVCEYSIFVTARTVEELELIYSGDMISCIVGGDFNHRAIIVNAHFNNGTQKVLSYGEYTVDGFNSDTIGIFNAYVTYKGVSEKILIKIEASVMEGLVVEKLPYKTIYRQGEDLDDSGLEIYAVYTNGSREAITEYRLLGYDPAALGRQSITVKYLGFTTCFSVYVFDESFDGIRVSVLPEKTVFTEKTAFGYEGLEVVFDTNNGEYTIPTEDLTISAPDMTRIGEKNVVINYASSECTYGIEIVPKKAVSFEIISSPEMFVCIKGGEVDAQGSELAVVYDNGETGIVALNPDMFVGFDSEKLGLCNAKVVLDEAEQTVSVWVVRAAVESIQITRAPEKLVYPERAEFDTTGLEILVKYQDGTFQAITADECLITGADLSQIGEKTVTVRFADKTDSFEITVVPRSLDRIEVVTYPTTLYVKGQYFSCDGMVVYAYYDNGESVLLSDYEYSVQAPEDVLEVGQYTVYVIYLGLYTQFDITVDEVMPVAIKVDAVNGKTFYHIDNCFESNGFKVYLVYNDGTEEEIDISECSIVGFDTSTAGTVTVSVVYGEFTDSFEITVDDTASAVKADMVINGMSSETIQGTPHNFEQLFIRILYSDGTYGLISSDVYSVSNYDYTNYGVYNAVVSYGEFEFTITLTVLPCKVAIEIESNPGRVDYLVGEALNTTGIKVVLVMSDGTRIDITDSAEYEYDFSASGTCAVSVYAEGFATGFEVNVYGYGLDDILPQENDTIYTVNGKIVIDSFGSTTTLEQLKQILNGTRFVSTDIEDSDLLYTGLVLNIVSDEKVYASYTVIVKGDLNGDGKADVSDAVVARRAISGWIELDEAQLIAADIAENNGFNITDVVKMVQYVETLV